MDFVLVSKVGNARSITRKQKSVGQDLLATQTNEPDPTSLGGIHKPVHHLHTFDQSTSYTHNTNAKEGPEAVVRISESGLKRYMAGIKSIVIKLLPFSA